MLLPHQNGFRLWDPSYSLIIIGSAYRRSEKISQQTTVSTTSHVAFINDQFNQRKDALLK